MREHKNYNLKGLLPKPLLPTMVPLQQQRVKICEQRVRTTSATVAKGENYLSLVGEQRLKIGWNKGCQ